MILGLFQTPIPEETTLSTEIANLQPTSTVPIPTPNPAPRINDADRFLRNGDYENALTAYRATLDKTPNEALYAVAMGGIARIALLENNPVTCQNTLIEALNNLQLDQAKPTLWFLMADCVQTLKLDQEEINALQEYVKLRPKSALLPEIYERIGDAQARLNDIPAARGAYQSAIGNTPMPADSTATIWMKIASSYAAEKNYTDALQTWISIYDNIQDEEIKARIDLLMADVYHALNSEEQALARYQDAVNLFPRHYDAYDALLKLIEARQPVNEYQRGLINYYRAKYANAIEIFTQYSNANPSHDGSAYFYIGLSNMLIGNYEKAITAFDKIIEEYPDNRFYADAWDEKAYIQWFYLEKYPLGAQTLIDYSKKHPDQEAAPKYIYEAGRILERANRLTDAANQWERLIDEYPTYEKSDLALFLSGVSRFRTENYDAALATFNRLLLVSGKPTDQARAHFWIAKVYQKKGATADTKKYFELAAEDSPTDYYTERAKEILAGKDALDFSPNFALQINWEQSRSVAEQWMKITFSLPDSTDLSQPEDLLLDIEYQKANELWEMGRYQDALRSFETVRLKLTEDPVRSFRLLTRLVELGAYRPAVYTSRQILTYAGLIEDTRTLTAPNYFNQIRYGVWFNEEVIAAYETYGIHPFILYGMMRQESMYDPWIFSAAGASGLMQIMPATGAEIAKQVGFPKHYQQQDLLRAIIAIPFSAKYLQTQHQYFKENRLHMLASYNAGAGNTMNWVDIDKNDPDLFVEIIRFEETRTYVRQVYEFAKMYERLYGLTP